MARKITLGQFLQRKHGGKVLTTDFGETHQTLSEFHLELSLDFQECECLEKPVTTMEGENGLQVYFLDDDGHLGNMVCVLTDPDKVIFRKWPKSEGGDVIAIMPELVEGFGKYACYQHIGQHGVCDRSIMWRTKPATEAEYADLKRELENDPYNYRFKVIRRWPN